MFGLWVSCCTWPLENPTGAVSGIRVFTLLLLWYYHVCSLLFSKFQHKVESMQAWERDGGGRKRNILATHKTKHMCTILGHFPKLARTHPCRTHSSADILQPVLNWEVGFKFFFKLSMCTFLVVSPIEPGSSFWLSSLHLDDAVMCFLHLNYLIDSNPPRDLKCDTEML